MGDVLVRGATSDDMQEVADVLACPGVIRGTAQLPYTSLDSVKKRFADRDPGDRFLVAEVDGRVVGSLGLRPGKARMAHVGSIGMAVHDDFQGRGIGTALVEAAVDLADNWLNLKRLGLSVFTDNAPAIHLYKNFGFEVEGTLRAHVLREGEYVDTYAMARIRL